MSGRRTKAIGDGQPPGTPEDPPLPPLPFESGIDRLEAIVRELEGGDLPLERSLLLFEEGTRLARGLNQTLGEAERRIEALIGEDGGTAPFGGGEEG